MSIWILCRDSRLHSKCILSLPFNLQIFMENLLSFLFVCRSCTYLFILLFMRAFTLYFFHLSSTWLQYAHCLFGYHCYKHKHQATNSFFPPIFRSLVAMLDFVPIFFSPFCFYEIELLLQSSFLIFFRNWSLAFTLEFSDFCGIYFFPVFKNARNFHALLHLPVKCTNTLWVVANPYTFFFFFFFFYETDSHAVYMTWLFFWEELCKRRLNGKLFCKRRLRSSFLL